MQDRGCWNCNKNLTCKKFFGCTEEELDEEWEERLSDFEIVKLFRGMSKSMQHSVVEIMRITQEKKHD